MGCSLPGSSVHAILQIRILHCVAMPSFRGSSRLGIEPMSPMSPALAGRLFFFTTYYISIRRRQWQATPVLLPRKSHGWRSLVGCSPWGHYKSDATERLHFHFSLSHNGEGNGNPLQCSCLENPRDGGAWWAAVYGVAQSRTRLKRLSSSSSILQ